MCGLLSHGLEPVLYACLYSCSCLLDVNDLRLFVISNLILGLCLRKCLYLIEWLKKKLMEMELRSTKISSFLEQGVLLLNMQLFRGIYLHRTMIIVLWTMIFPSLVTLVYLLVSGLESETLFLLLSEKINNQVSASKNEGEKNILVGYAFIQNI